MRPAWMPAAWVLRDDRRRQPARSASYIPFVFHTGPRLPQGIARRRGLTEIPPGERLVTYAHSGRADGEAAAYQPLAFLIIIVDLAGQMAETAP